MKAFETLPEGYQKIYSLHLQKEKKKALLVNLLALLIGVGMAVPMHFVVPITSLFDLSEGLGPYTIRFAALLGGMILYIFLHEAVHGITMKLCGTKKVKYGFTGLYAFAGSEDYYDKSSYLLIAMAPVAVFFVLFGVLNLLVSENWFWVIYLLQITNISGAAGDFYVTVKFAAFPSDILVQDSGVGMSVYSRNI
ncbi:MAG: DUF3267 domain-containing protein [Oscillospiraceae bacterium]|nr:DUF3267 domain-containing protein [Oscillospiraceae bacterium]